VHASMAPHKSEQEHNRNLFPKCLGGGDENLRSAAIRTMLQANPPHFVPLCHLVSHPGPACVLPSPALSLSLASFMVNSLPAFSAGHQDNEDADSDSPHPPNGLCRPFHSIRIRPVSLPRRPTL
jgi:hypothetical protein